MLNDTMPKRPEDYGIEVWDTPERIDAQSWDDLLACQSHATPFMRYAYLAALHRSGCASTPTGWTTLWFVLRDGPLLNAACVLYVKSHSRGEYVFDQGWAQAYARHGLAYYPKAICAVPFTPVSGSRLLARSEPARQQLVQALVQWTQNQQLSSLHLLFGSMDDVRACTQAGLLTRHTVQFHWNNSSPGYASFDSFLATLTQEKRKKIRQERRKVSQAGVVFEALQGPAIGPEDWDFFYRCYERTYLEHGNAPYLNRAFFASMAQDMPEDWLLFVGKRQGRPIAASLIALNRSMQANNVNTPAVAYGRYWGALERVDCLHFEACYYQPLEWCIAHVYQRFEGGAQGEHKLARALLPVNSYSAHWLAHPDFFDAVSTYLSQEREAIGAYVDELQRHSPLKQKPEASPGARPDTQLAKDFL